jgi:hypothetical protein
MAYNEPKPLVSSGTQIASSTGVVYTAPAGKLAQVLDILVHNTNTTVENVVVYWNGAASANRLFNISLVANETYEFKIPIYLNGGETIQAATTTASKVNIILYGREQQ